MEADYQRRMLQHCLWMAARQPRYALWAAGDYEAKSAGVLDGLRDKVDEAIKRREKQEKNNA